MYSNRVTSRFQVESLVSIREEYHSKYPGITGNVESLTNIGENPHALVRFETGQYRWIPESILAVLPK